MDKDKYELDEDIMLIDRMIRNLSTNHCWQNGEAISRLLDTKVELIRLKLEYGLE